MEVPPSLLEILKCTKCEVNLSRSPVYLQHDDATICGRCYKPSQHPANRNTIYEATAKLLNFPCKYQDLGCNETVPFVDQNEEIPHEVICKYRQYVCPIEGSSKCDWMGKRRNILTHCKSEHSDKIIENPTTLTHDISKSNMKTFLLLAFEVLFLLHIKVCLISGKIFHSIRCLCENSEAEKYVYTLDIKRGNEQLSKEGQVASQGILAMQEPTSLAVNTNSLLDVLGGFDGTSFTITLKRKDGLADVSKKYTKKEVCTIMIEDPKSNKANAEDTNRKMKMKTKAISLGKCVKCQNNVTEYLLRTHKGWLCTNCGPAKRACTYKSFGCMYEHTQKMCEIHELYFCNYNTDCRSCSSSLKEFELFTHFRICHLRSMLQIGSLSTIRLTKTNKKLFLIYNEIINAIGKYKLTDERFNLNIYLRLPSQPSCKYTCTIRLTDPHSGISKIYSPPGPCSKDCDWAVDAATKKFSSWSGEFDISINITTGQGK